MGSGDNNLLFGVSRLHTMATQMQRCLLELVIRKRSALNQGAKSFGGEVSADVCERIECGTLETHALEARASQPDVKA